MARMAVVLALLLVPLAGCSEDPGLAAVAAAQDAFLTGVVVTEAIVPIANASLTAMPGELLGTTDATGQFSIGPVAPGSYTLRIRVDGYADTTVQAQTGPTPTKVVMVAVRTDVPYIEVLSYDGYLECTFDTWVSPYQILGAPCMGIIDLVAGVDVSNDNWQFQFDVSAPGLAGILVEMVWEEQATGSHMGMLLRNVAGAGSGVDAGGTNVDTQFASTHGPAPLQMWVYQGIENPGADDGAAFQEPQNATMEYQVLILGRADYDQPADVHLMLQNRPQVFLTKFYNAIGDPSYSVLNA